eukprot:jgi/Botrbrau1/15770/Bobra.4_1s0131.1
MSRFTLTATDFGICSTQWRRQRQVSVQQQEFFLGRHRERPFMRVNGRHRSVVQPVNTYPEPETEKERSPVDFPQEWITPQPSRRPDVQPEFEKFEVPLPKKMPGDPELPEDEEEEEEKKKKEPQEDPDKEKPDQPQPEE